MLKDPLTKKIFFCSISILILIISIFFFILYFTQPTESEKSTILISLLSFGASLAAPVVAYIFYYSWKAQTKFNRVSSNILELQKTLHDYVTELKFLRHRIIFPHSRNKFQKEEDYINNLKKLFDQKVGEISIAERLKFESYKILSILRIDTYNMPETVITNLNKLEDVINHIYHDIQEFKFNYFSFINHYYKNENELKAFLKSEEYKNLTYKISSTRETNNVIKSNLKLALTLDEGNISPETTLKIHKYIQDIDSISLSILKDYEKNFRH